MPTKEAILDNVGEYTAEQLVEFINSGIVTFEELCNDTDGMLTPAKRNKIKDLLEHGDDDAWSVAKAENSIEAYKKYLRTYPDGTHREEARQLIKSIKEKATQEEKDAEIKEEWEAVDKNNIDALDQFAKKYPDSGYAKEALELINNLFQEELQGPGITQWLNGLKAIETNQTLNQSNSATSIVNLTKNFLDNKKITRDELLSEIQKDHNILYAEVAKDLIDSKYLSISDLASVGIDKVFIQKLYSGEKMKIFDSPEKLTCINRPSTEIYFWGIPSSGKSCALGAILSVVNSGEVSFGMDMVRDCQGYGYMNELINLFRKNEVGVLMEGTSVIDFYEMGFDLTDNDKKIHPITCIDMAGELMRCMYKENARKTLSNEQRMMLETMTNVLVDNASSNRKIHVFVIEYGAENRIYEGLRQSTYLDGAATYIKDTGIFRKDTDAIYIMVSKADRAHDKSANHIIEYINDKYRGFVNNLQLVCEKNEINGGKVNIMAFSLGEVCFKNYCRFNSRPAENFVKTVMLTTATKPAGKIGRWWNKIKG